jgi:nonsense-mediated mRNA decay protein 3
MDIKQGFCPRCGGPSDEGLCNRCRAEECQWLQCDPRVAVTCCPSCGSLKQGGSWTDIPFDRERLKDETALSAVHVHNDVRDVSIGLEVRDPSPNRTVCRVDVTGTLYGVPVSGTCQVLIVWKKEQCDRCSRLSGGYYAGTVQVRATGRKPDRFETDQAAAIAQSIEDTLQENGERLSFISDINETKDGLDITVSSHHIGEMISRDITRALGGRYTTHPKLVGEKDGKALYRITYAIRLPCFQKGDILAVPGGYAEVRGIESSGMKLFDLRSGIQRVMPQDCTLRLIGNVREAKDALVAYIQGDTAGVMDPETFATVEMKAYAWLGLIEGQQIRVLRDHEQDVLVMVG